jgi:glyoxalase family protein
MVHRVAFRVASEESLDFWQDRVGGDRNNGSLVFDDPEGLSLELMVDDSRDSRLWHAGGARTARVRRRPRVHARP